MSELDRATSGRRYRNVARPLLLELRFDILLMVGFSRLLCTLTQNRAFKRTFIRNLPESGGIHVFHAAVTVRNSCAKVGRLRNLSAKTVGHYAKSRVVVTLTAKSSDEK